MFLRKASLISQLYTIKPRIYKQIRNISEATNKNVDNGESDEVKKAQQANFKQSAPTIFDKIIAREIKADIIFEDDKCLAFNDVSPQAPIHFLIIPKRRIAMLEHGRQSDIELFGHLMLKAGTLGQERAPNGFRVVVNNGKEGSQSVYHLHLHVLGGRQMQWPPG